MIDRRRIPFDIRFHVDTPGVPVEVRYRSEVFEVIDGVETIISVETQTDCNASGADVLKYLGDALTAGRDEEQRAISSERAAIARADQAEAECDALRAQIAAASEEGRA